MTKKLPYSIPTQLIYGKFETGKWNYANHIVPPMSLSSSFRLQSAERGAEAFSHFGEYGLEESQFFYERMGEPNKDMLEETLAIAEGGECCFTFGSGMGAISAATGFALNETANEIISHKTIYGCTFSLFSNWYKKIGIKVNYCNLKDPRSFLPLVTEKTRILYLESPANPTLDLLDLEAIANLVKEVNKNRKAENRIITIMDNTFATPWGQRPIEHGIEVVVHSMTKNLSGFGACLGGAVITNKEHFPLLSMYRKDYGGNLSPQTAWQILVYGLPSLGIRINKQTENAKLVASFLESHPKVEKVYYPGLESFPQHDLAKRMLKDYNGKFMPGTLIFFHLKGESLETARDMGRKLMNRLAEDAYCITLAVSLGQLKTLIEHPGSMTHSAYSLEKQLEVGIHPGGIRLSLGIEEPEDIINDLKSALSNL